MATAPVPSYSQMRAFVALCDHQHFGSAAQALGVSQPSLSQAITALEKRVGGELVERTTRRVLVTPLGQALLPYAREAARAAEAFVDVVQAQGQVLTGTLRLGVIPTLAPYIAPIILDGLRRTMPHIQPELREMVTGDILQQLDQGRIDAAIISTGVTLQRALAIPMFDEPLVALVPAEHPWAGRSNISPSELSTQQLLLLDEGNCLRDQTLALCNRDGQRPPLAVATTLSTVMQMVGHGMGVTVIPEGALQLIGDQHRCAVARFAQTPPVRHIGLVHRISTSRVQDFARLAGTLTQLCQEAQLPVIPATLPTLG